MIGLDRHQIPRSPLGLLEANVMELWMKIRANIGDVLSIGKPGIGLLTSLDFCKHTSYHLISSKLEESKDRRFGGNSRQNQQTQAN